MKKFLTAVLAIGLIGMAGLTFATAKTISEDTVASSQAKSGEMETQEYAGMVVNTESGITLMAKDAAYLLIGEKLEDLVGKTVTVNGKLIKGDIADTILVAKIRETK